MREKEWWHCKQFGFLFGEWRVWIVGNRGEWVIGKAKFKYVDLQEKDIELNEN